MAVNERTRLLAARLEAVVWEEDYAFAYSRIRLMREYLRRSALWARELDVLDEWPFFDVAPLIDPGVALDEDFVAATMARLVAAEAPPHHRQYCEFALRFAALDVPAPQLPDPFEPLVCVYERGGKFAMEAGSINFAHSLIVPRRSAEPYLKPGLSYDISDQALAALDAKWQAEVAERTAGSVRHE